MYVDFYLDNAKFEKCKEIKLNKENNEKNPYVFNGYKIIKKKEKIYAQ